MAYFYRGAQSPRDEHPPPASNNPLSPQRNPNRLSGGMQMANGSARGGLPRRFTTNELPTVSPFLNHSQQRKLAAGDYLPTSIAKMMPSEARVRQYEELLQQQRRIQAAIDELDPAMRLDVDQGKRHEQQIQDFLASSEPASPPEYANAFPNAFSKPNRYSTASLASVPGITNRPSRSNTQLTSPSAGFVRPYTSGGTYHLPSQSVPGSRRQSDDEEDDDTFIYGLNADSHRAAANPNRNSMPITGYSRKRNPADLPSLGPVNTASFLFGDDEDDQHTIKPSSTTTSPPTSKTYLQVQQTPDGFPKLIRREDTVNLSSSALDLALARGVDPTVQATDRSTASRHRVSLPPAALGGNVGIAPLNSILANAENKASANNRRSVEVKFSAETKRPSLASPPRVTANGTLQKAPSYSTNDIPTLKSMNGDLSASNVSNITSPPRQPNGIRDPTSPQNNISRILSSTSSTTHKRASQDFASIAYQTKDSNDNIPAYSGLQAEAAPFGPMAHGAHDSPLQQVGQNGISPYAQPPFYGGYNMQMLNNGLHGMNIGGAYGGQPQWQGQMNPYNQPGQFGGNGYQTFGQNGNAVSGAGRYGDQQRQAMQQRRQAQEEAQARYNTVTITQLQGEIYTLCKDQHGCRFLQRKLDERDDGSVDRIYEEVKDHIIELMTDPFGNYLCQKLLECASDDQRTVLIKNAASSMAKIALNQHGTRALQKMIEYITLPEQTEVIIQALRYDVVQLIQDLNGNHVIQKCLNHLTPENAQFIFDAVGAHCVVVGTHRHGCCVLQRCIDHASGIQKGALVDQVIANAFSLVQDPFGNYVVQYILDLGESCFTEPLCASFAGQIAYLSKQKFSSNVVEKCIRCANNATRRNLVDEIIVPAELDKLLRDSFANYVVQTALDYADEETKIALVDNIRPLLPAIRHTPYGRRIQTKISEYDARVSAASSNPASATQSGVVTPSEHTLSPPTMNGSMNGGSPYGNGGVAVSGGRANRQGWAGPPPQWSAFANGSGMPNHFEGLNTSPNGAYGGSFSVPVANGEVTSPTPQRHGHGNSAFFPSNGDAFNSGANGFMGNRF